MHFGGAGRKDALDAVNRRRFQKGADYEYNAGVDPRAGHGPGIGGFKAQSQIGMALKEGHPCYYVGFSPMPEPGQTIEAVMHAEARFIEKVTQLHPKAEGKPVVVGGSPDGRGVVDPCGKPAPP